MSLLCRGRGRVSVSTIHMPFQLSIRPETECRWALAALGEVMLRLDPGDGRIHTTRTFQVWEGGGEYNVARGLRRCFGLPTRPSSRRFADNPVGRLVEDLMFQGGVDQSRALGQVRRRRPRRPQRTELHRARLRRARARWAVPIAGTPPSRSCKPGDIDWDELFGKRGVRWFHTGGIFCALSESTPLVAESRDGGGAAARHGHLVRPELPRVAVEGRSAGRRARAR